MIEYTVRVYPNGSKYWYLNNKWHREDGPAVALADGSKYWYLNDKLHREDGPAVEYADGHKAWWLNGKRLSEEEHKRRTSKVVEMTMEEISKALGKQVKVVE